MGSKHSNVRSCLGSGRGVVGGAIVYDNRDLRFESSHWQKLYLLLTEKTKIGMAKLKKSFLSTAERIEQKIKAQKTNKGIFPQNVQLCYNFALSISTS